MSYDTLPVSRIPTTNHMFENSSTCGTLMEESHFYDKSLFVLTVRLNKPLLGIKKVNAAQMLPAVAMACL